MLLLTERKFYDAIRGDFAGADDLALVADGMIVDAHGAALDVTASFAVRPGKADGRTSARLASALMSGGPHKHPSPSGHVGAGVQPAKVRESNP